MPVRFTHHQPEAGSPWARDLVAAQEQVRQAVEALQKQIDFARPVGSIVMAKLTASEVGAYFDSTGLGRSGLRYDGWAIANGNNGTEDWNDRFPLCDNTGAGGIGGDHSSAHTHSTPAHSHDASGLYANLDINAGNIHGEFDVAAPDYTFNVTGSATGWSRDEVTTGSENRGLVVDGTTATDGAGTTGAASASDNRPAFRKAVWVQRVA